MEVSRHCEEKQFNESLEQMEARKQKRKELQAKFARERAVRRREKERIKMEEGRGRRYQKMMMRKEAEEEKMKASAEQKAKVSVEEKAKITAEERMKVLQMRKTEIWKEKYEEQEENIKKWKKFQQGDSNGVVEEREIVEGSQKEGKEEIEVKEEVKEDEGVQIST